ncbi:Cohesin domain-containing protein [Ruminococcus sp. YRD2003]|uniref:cohesin domain-containing protein n=1 Tax=Ruminococcus sp. YRD2003 TaxID=1452313 RepID=UPI0008AF18D8|nr:Cohesin domain-containing protein [Ruminococcus flavefaciens]
MKKILSIIMAAVMPLAIMQTVPYEVCAESSYPQINVGIVSAYEGMSVDVPVSISGNLGLVALSLTVEYDTSALRLTGSDDSELFYKAAFTSSGSNNTKPYRLMWDNGVAQRNYTNNGELAVLHFEVLEGAETGLSEISISVENDSTFDMNMDTVEFDVVNGGVDIVDSAAIATTATTVSKIPDKKSAAQLKAMTVDAKAGASVDIPIKMSRNSGVIALCFTVSYDKEAMKLVSVDDGEIFPGADFVTSGKTDLLPYRIMWDNSLADTNYTANGIAAVLHFEVLETAENGLSEVTIAVDPANTFDVFMDPVAFETENGGVLVSNDQVSTTVTTTSTQTTTTTTLTTKTSNTSTQTTAASTTDEPVTTTTAEQPDADLGDVNSDGKVDAKDASMVLMAYARMSTGSEDGLTEKQRKDANVNCDDKVDAKDASSILAYYALVSTASGDIPTMKEFMTPKQT